MGLFDRLTSWTPSYRERLPDMRANRASTFSGPFFAETAVTSAAAHPVVKIASRQPGHASIGMGQRQTFEMHLFHALRELVPVLHEAITKRRQVEGMVYVEAESDRVQDALTEFIQTVDVGYVEGDTPSRGVNAYLNMLAENADEYGLGVGEIIYRGSRGRSIERLVVPDSRTFSILKEMGQGAYRLYQYQGGTRVAVEPGRVQLMTFSYATDSPWPRPMAWGLPFVSELLVRMVTSSNNAWLRFGDPKYLWAILYESGAMTTFQGNTESGGSEEDPNIRNLANSLMSVYKAAKQGKTGDAYWSGQGTKAIEKMPLGDVESSMMKYFPDQYQIISDQVWSRSDLPYWMKPGANRSGGGVNSDRFEQENLAAADAADDRRTVKTALAREVLDAFLLAEGLPIDSYEIRFKGTSITSEKYKEETRKIAAEADERAIANVIQLYEEDGKPRFTGDADEYLRSQGVLEPHP